MSSRSDNTRLDIFNQVGERTMLSHQNMAVLLRDTMVLTGVNVEDYRKEYHEKTLSQAVIPSTPQDESIDVSLLGAIKSFADNINPSDPNSSNNRCSIVIARGHLSGPGRKEIRGASHWSCLHLRYNPTKQKVEIFHLNSSNPQGRAENLPQINRILQKANSGPRGNLFETNFTSLPCTKQTDGFSCGYHAALNAVSTLQEDDLERLKNPAQPQRTILTQTATGAPRTIAFDEFLTTRRQALQTQFGTPGIGATTVTSWKGSLPPRTDDNTPTELETALNKILEVIENISLSVEHQTCFSAIKSIFVNAEKLRQAGQDSLLQDLKLENIYESSLSYLVVLMREQNIFQQLTAPGQNTEQDAEIQKFIDNITSQKTANNIRNIIAELENLVNNPTRDNLIKLNRKLQPQKQQATDTERPREDTPRDQSKENAPIRPKPSPASLKAAAESVARDLRNLLRNTQTKPNTEEKEKAFRLSINNIACSKPENILEPNTYCGIGAEANYSYDPENNIFIFTITEVFANSKASSIGLKMGDKLVISSKNQGKDDLDIVKSIRNIGACEVEYEIKHQPKEGQEKDITAKLKESQPSIVHSKTTLKFDELKTALTAAQSAGRA